MTEVRNLEISKEMAQENLIEHVTEDALKKGQRRQSMLKNLPKQKSRRIKTVRELIWENSAFDHAVATSTVLLWQKLKEIEILSRDSYLKDYEKG